MNRASVWKVIQNSTWLLGGVMMLATAFMLWIGIQVHQRLTVEQPLEQPDLPVEPEKVRFSPTLGMMTDVVPELNIKKDVTTEEHEAEFRGADFIKQYSGRWTLQVMSVTQESVIRNYLAKRDDRDQFYYFRYVEENKPQRYILTYGAFNSVNTALSSMKSTDLGLPDSVKAFPERFSTYKAHVIDSDSDAEIVNLSRQGRVYQVRLRSVPVPVDLPVVSPAMGGIGGGVVNPAVDGRGVSNTPPLNNTGSGASSQTPLSIPATAPTEPSIQDPFN